MVWRLTDSGGGMRKDIEATMDLYMSPGKFQFRGIADESVYKDEASRRLTTNYARGFVQEESIDEKNPNFNRNLRNLFFNAVSIKNIIN